MAAQVKKYDPNQYNFGDFAKTMNQNFAIERAQNGQGGAFGVNAGVNAANPVNLGGTTNSQTLGNLGTFGTRDRYNNITGNFTGLLKRFNAGEQVMFGEPSPLPLSDGTVPAKTGGSAQTFPQFAEEYKPYDRGLMQGDNVISNWNGQPPQTQPPQQEPTQEIITEQEPKQEIITDENGSVGTGGNGTPGLLERLTSLAGSQVNAGEGAMDFETWQSAYSVDPVVEYQNAQAQLDYEFKTWMSDYGARAEQLYQMGLSNSGVSDIYGANAYTAYVQASMDLKRAQIQQQKENRQMYQKYVDEYEAAKAAKTEAANLKMSSAFNTYSASYNPGLEASVRASLAANGMSESEINTVIGNLNAYYYALPEDQRPDVVAGNATVDAAVSWLNTNYTSGMTDEELSAMLGSTYSADVVQKALEKFAPFKAVIDRLAGDEAARNAFNAMLEMVSAGDTDVESLKAKAKGLGYSEDAIAKAAENIAPFIADAQGNQPDSATIINDAAVRIATTIFTDAETGTSTYTGSESQKNYIRQLMQLAEYKDVAPYVEEIIAKMDENLAATKGAEAGDVGDAFGSITENESWLSDPTTSTMENYSTTLEQYKQKYGVNSQEYKDVLSAGSTSIKDYILKATDDVDMLDQAGSWLGIDFADMDDADKINAMLEGAGELHKQGYMTDNDYEEIINEWITGEISLVSGDKSSFFGLSQIVGHIEGYLDEGYMSESMFNKIVGEISKSVSLGKGQFVGNNTSTIETSNGDTIPLNANVFMNVTMSGADKGSSWSVSAMSVYGLYNNESEASEFEKKIKRMFGNVGAAVPIHYNGEIYFWSQSGHLYKANMDESFFEKDGKKETKDQAEWSKQLILSVISNNGPKPINTQR